MMLLGLVLHSAASYTATPLAAAWPYQDPSTSRLFDILVYGIHLFRMPVFFVMAGFFAALLYAREGPRGFLVNRTRRVLIPLIVAWIVVFPLVAVGFLFALTRGGVSLEELAARFAGSSAGSQVNLAHLWFLYDLFIFYLVALAAAPLLRRLPPPVLAGIERAFGRFVPGVGGVLACSVVTAATLLAMPGAALETSPAFLPPVRVLAAYLVFFVFGWVLFLRRDLVDRFARRPWAWLAAAVIMSGVYIRALLVPVSDDELTARVVAVAAGAPTIWLWVYAVIGLFVRYGNSPRPIQRYLADGSYWIYLIHLPFTIVVPGLLHGFAWPAIVKFSIVLGVTTLVTVGTYHFLVRSTRIGVALNGRRFERRLPRQAAAV